MPYSHSPYGVAHDPARPPVPRRRLPYGQCAVLADNPGPLLDIPLPLGTSRNHCNALTDLVSAVRKEGSAANYQKLANMISEILAAPSWAGESHKAVYATLALSILTSQWPNHWSEVYRDTIALFIKMAIPLTLTPPLTGRRICGSGTMGSVELLEFLKKHQEQAVAIATSQKQQWGPRLKVYTTAEKPDHNLLLAAAAIELAFPRASIHRMVPGAEETVNLLNSEDSAKNLSFGLTDHNAEGHFGRKTDVTRESGGPSMTAASSMWRTYGKTILERLSIQGSEAALTSVLKQVDQCLFLPLDQAESGMVGWIRSRWTKAFGWRTAIENLIGGNTDQDYRLLVEWVKPILVRIIQEEAANVLKSLTTEHLTWIEAQQLLGPKLSGAAELAEGAVQLMGVTVYPRRLVQKIQQKQEESHRIQLQKDEIDRITREVTERLLREGITAPRPGNVLHSPGKKKKKFRG